MKKRRLIGPLTPIQEQQETLKDVGLPEDLVRKIYETITNQVINGKKEGFHIEVHLDKRTIFCKCTYLRDEKHGLFQKWRPNGKPWEYIVYRNGKEHGPYKYYWEYEDIYVDTQCVDGLQHGESRVYHDGKLEVKTNYVFGKLHGEYLKYKDGKVVEKANYMYGKLHGEYLKP